MLKSVPVTNLIAHIEERRAIIGVIGLGYVGMPLSLVAATAGFKVIGFDIDAMRVAQINRGESFINHIPASAVVSALSHRRLEATAAFGRLGEPDAKASTASRAQRVVTIAKRPSGGRETGEVLKVICPTAKAKYFSQHGWTACQLICPSGTNRLRNSSQNIGVVPAKAGNPNHECLCRTEPPHQRPQP